jgi:hypothetical protein
MLYRYAFILTRAGWNCELVGVELTKLWVWLCQSRVQEWNGEHRRNFLLPKDANDRINMNSKHKSHLTTFGQPCQPLTIEYPVSGWCYARDDD